MKTQHIVALSNQYKCMSVNTINKALRALSESGLWSKDAIEKQISHQERNSVRAAYIHKADYLEERIAMMQCWADYLDANIGGYISPYQFASRLKKAS